MAGPHSPNPAVGADGRHEPETLEFPEDVSGARPAFPVGPGAIPPGAMVTPGATYPGQLPPPPTYPKRRPKRLIIATLLALMLVAGLTAAIVYGVRTNGANTGATFSETSAKTAIQGYLNALVHKDVDTIVRNALCGIYDSVKDKRSDQALAKLSSDAFRKQFSQVDVTSIDKIVYWSQYQAQVLFTMQVTPATGGPPRGQVQGVAQLLFQRGQISVCSYVLRTAGQY